MLPFGITHLNLSAYLTCLQRSFPPICKLPYSSENLDETFSAKLSEVKQLTFRGDKDLLESMKTAIESDEKVFALLFVRKFTTLIVQIKQTNLFGQDEI